MTRHTSVSFFVALLLAGIAVLLLGAPLTNALFPAHSYLMHRGTVGILFTPLPLIGTLLIYLAMSVYRRRQAALYSSLVIVVGTLGYLVACSHRLLFAPLIILELLMAAYVVVGVIFRGYFIVKSNRSSGASVVKMAVTVISAGLAYGTLGLLTLGPRFFNHTFTIIDALMTSLQTIATLGDAIDEPTRVATLFVNSLIGVGVVVVLIVAQAFFRPLRAVSSAIRSYRSQASRILEQSSVSSEDFFKLWPEDKHYFFSATRQSFVCYKHKGRTAIILGDPSGDLGEFRELLLSFCDFANQNGWSVAAINATDYGKQYYISAGLADLFVGNEAIVEISSFMATTSTNKHFRYVTNKAKRDGLTIDDWGHPSNEQIKVLRQISDAWLERGGRREYTFFMGYFDAKYIRQCRIFVLYQHNLPVAYINILPSFSPVRASIDHLRSRPDVSSAGMHFLLAGIIAQLDRERVETLNIGFAPLSGLTRTVDGKRVSMKALLGLIKRIGNRYYSFKGIEQFKGKFQPEWQSRSLLYTGGVAELPRIISEIERATNLTRPVSRLGVIVATVTAIVVITVLYTVLS
jgi:phosphatidylglycerol lysyltransferase